MNRTPSNTQFGHVMALTAIFFSVAEPFATDLSTVVTATIFALAFVFYAMDFLPRGETIARTLSEIRQRASEVRG